MRTCRREMLMMLTKDKNVKIPYTRSLARLWNEKGEMLQKHHEVPLLRVKKIFKKCFEIVIVYACVL
jgi:hypothetical protein